MNSDRDLLFGNEAFVIGVLQAVSGGALVAGLSQIDAILRMTSKSVLLWFLSFMAFALCSAVTAALLKHEYKMWDVKSQASRSRGDDSESRKRASIADKNLWSMRWAVRISTISILMGVGLLILSMWANS